MSTPLVRTWCCNTSADGPHRQGCEAREDDPIDYAGPVEIRSPTIVEALEGCTCFGPTVTAVDCPLHAGRVQLLPMPEGLIPPVKPEGLRPVSRLTAEQIREISQGIVANEYFVGSVAPADLWPIIFLPIGLGGLADIDLDTLGNIVERWSKAGDRGINGFPIFMSCVPVHTDDWAVIVEWVGRFAAAMGSVVDEMEVAVKDEPVKPVEKEGE